jgi:hypothetical protein
MIQHEGAIFREFITTKDAKSSTLKVLVALNLSIKIKN